MNTALLERRFEEIKQEAERRKVHEEFACKKCAWGDGRACTNALVKGFDEYEPGNIDRQISAYSEGHLRRWGTTNEGYGTAVLYCGLDKNLWEPRPTALDRVLARLEAVHDWCASALRKGGV